MLARLFPGRQGSLLCDCLCGLAASMLTAVELGMRKSEESFLKCLGTLQHA